MDRAALITVLTFLTATALVAYRHRRNALPYPPGPRPKWFIGNFMDMPSSFPWLRFSQWGATYGEITYVNILGLPMVILNTLAACRELLEARGATTAGRPLSIMLELMGIEKGLTQHQDTAWWRYQRKLTFSAFGPQAVKQYHRIHELHNTQFIKKMLADPSADCATELRLAIGKIIFAVTYGLPTKNHFDEFTQMNEIVAEAFLGATVPGRYLVESFPLLRYIPQWFPLANFRRHAAYITDLAARQTAQYYDAVKREIAAGTAPPSFVANCLAAQAAGDVKSPLGSKEQDEDALAWAASGMYRAGTTTTEQTIYKFLIAMQHYPEIQRKAQEEVLRVVGTDRLPTTEDRESLPYVNAVITECLRWHAGIAIGIPHRTTKDDVYKGYFIPKNTSIFFNSWNLSLHAEDGSRLERPMEFIPERFLPQSDASTPTPHGKTLARLILRADSTYDGLEKLYFNEPLSPQSPPRLHGSEVTGFESGWLSAGQDPQSIRWRSLEQFYHPNAVRERAAQAAVDLWLQEQEEAANNEKAAGEVVDWMGGTADGVLRRAEALVDETLEVQGVTREDVSPNDLDELRDAAVQTAMAELRAVAPEGVNKGVLLDLRAKFTLLHEHMELVARHRLDAIRKRHLDPSASPVNWRAVGALMGRRGRALDQWAEYMAGLSEAMIEEKRDTVDALLDLRSAERALADQKDEATHLKPDEQFAAAVKQDTEDGASKVKGDLAALRALENREHAATKPFEYLGEDVLALLSPAERAEYESARAAYEASTPRWKRARRERAREKDDLRRLEAEELAASQRLSDFGSRGKDKRGASEQSAADAEAARLRRSEFKPSDFIPYSREYINGLMTFPLLARRTTQQTGKGKINSSYVLVVVGNGAGLVGVGEGKDYDTPARARDKAIADAVRNMDVVERFEERTIWTEVQSKMGATRIILRPRPVGFGLHCNPYIHQILKAAGIKDVSAKVWGSRNPLNVIKTVQRMLHAGHAPVRFGSGTMGSGGRRTEAFSGIRGKDSVERERGRKLVPGRAW